jgi:Mycothiol maleylpyruvate isomerase N-terminal domain
VSDRRTAFLAAARSFVDQVSLLPVAALAGPGLGEWDLRALIGHTSRSLVTVETYLGSPADEVVVPTAAHYYLAIADTVGAGGPEIIERGRRAGTALGDDPAGFVRALAHRVADQLSGYDDDFCLTTIAGGMRLDEYLRTRTFELVVHGYDIAAAAGPGVAGGEGSGPATAAVLDAATLAAEVAVLEGRGADLLLAATGRATLPRGFSVV